MTRDGHGVASPQSSTRAMNSPPATPTPTATQRASLQATQRVREYKARLFQALQRRHRDAWRVYWAAFQKYLLANMSIQEFHATAERLLGAENIMLHNAFVVALLQDCSYSGAADNPKDYVTSGSSSSGSEELSSAPEIKAEPSPQRDEHPDTESAQLLMGLGRFVGSSES